MFARLITNSTIPAASAQTIFLTTIGVITGSITSNTQIDPTVYNRGACLIVNTTPSGWTLIDSSANLVSNSVISGTSPPVVIGSTISDDPTRGKYLYIGQTYAGNTVLDACIAPFEGWDATTKTASNGTYITPTGNSTVLPFTAGSGGYANLTGGAWYNTSNNCARWYNLYSPIPLSTIGNAGTLGPLTTIISTSNSHFFIANYVQPRAGSASPPTFLNYFFLSEYSRDDPWATVANGFPPWFFEGASVPLYATTAFLGKKQANNYFNVGNPQLLPPAFGSGANAQHYGIVQRALSNNPLELVRGLPMFYTSGSSVFNPSSGQCVWGLTTRYFNWSLFSFAVGGPSADNASTTGNFPASAGLATVGNYVNFLGNQNTTRDVNKNPALPISEIRLTRWASDTNFEGNIVSSPGIVYLNAGGSLNAVNPYIWAFKAGYNTFDEISLGGNTYMNLILNQAPSGNTWSSNILVLER